jgi:preprotein translocase subunit SecA
LLTKDKIKNLLLNIAKEKYEKRKQELTEEVFLELQRIVLLHMLDTAWREHLYELDHLRRSVGLRAYGQKDPLIEYKKESYNLFLKMQARIREQTVEYIYKLQPMVYAQKQSLQQQNVVTQQQNVASKPVSPITMTEKPQKVKIGKIGRNDPCPCGSGKKYKKCCGKDIS